MRVRYFYDALDWSYTEKLYNPRGWLAYSGGKAHDTRYRIAAWAWIVRRSWRIAGDDVRLARVLQMEDRRG